MILVFYSDDEFLSFANIIDNQKVDMITQRTFATVIVSGLTFDCEHIYVFSCSSFKMIANAMLGIICDENHLQGFS